MYVLLYVWEGMGCLDVWMSGFLDVWMYGIVCEVTSQLIVQHTVSPTPPPLHGQNGALEWGAARPSSPSLALTRRTCMRACCICHVHPSIQTDSTEESGTGKPRRRKRGICTPTSSACVHTAVPTNHRRTPACCFSYSATRRGVCFSRKAVCSTAATGARDCSAVQDGCTRHEQGSVHTCQTDTPARTARISRTGWMGESYCTYMHSPCTGGCMPTHPTPSQRA